MMGKPKANFRAFLTVLKADGWTVDHDGPFDKERCCILTKELADRKLELQLWGRGGHRISHWVDGSMNTHPTSFSELASMVDAIAHESARRDNRRLAKVVVDGVTLSVLDYRSGSDRNQGHNGFHAKNSHTYAMMSDGELLPMCGYGWNRSDGDAFSILRGSPGTKGSCKICRRNVAMNRPPIADGFPHKTRWL